MSSVEIERRIRWYQRPFHEHLVNTRPLGEHFRGEEDLRHASLQDFREDD
ncbi:MULTISPECIES: hypothetical protein [unclassified Mesorhizobium]|nr:MULTISPECIES: hypothetical protein [unclassified Mesorhizobium]MBZ9739987.1 hypothetical protein [Mesorhizobium sp. CO1-1-4]MBZ9806159.1 hypothetical protein [Mesorhizobium sp. ES1-6]